MTEKLQSIFKSIGTLAAYKDYRKMSDTDFIATVEAANLLCNLYDNLGIDRTEIRSEMDAMYFEFYKRIRAEKDIQQSIPLIKALYDFIYGRKVNHADRGPANRRKALVQYCTKAVEAYRNTPRMHASDYLYALLTAARVSNFGYDVAVGEYKAYLNEFIKNIDVLPVDERVRRVWAFSELRNHIRVDNYEQWLEHKEALKYIDTKQLDDATFILWCEAVGVWPEDELARRSGESKRLKVEHLRQLAIAAIGEDKHNVEKKKLEKELHGLNDELIRDFIRIKIEADMPVSTLNALKDIFFMRLQLAQVMGEDNEPTYELLCRLRFKEIARALMKKYPETTELNERINILDSLETLSQLINYEHSEMALEEAMKLSDLPELNDYQRFCLDNIFRQDYSECDKTIDRLLPQTHNAFDMKTLISIEEMGTETRRHEVMAKYSELFNKALAEKNSAELAGLLSAVAYCNTNPEWRPFLSGLASNAATFSNIPTPEKRINLLAAEIYTSIDTLTGKYEHAGAVHG